MRLVIEYKNRTGSTREQFDDIVKIEHVNNYVIITHDYYIQHIPEKYIKKITWEN